MNRSCLVVLVVLSLCSHPACGQFVPFADPTNVGDWTLVDNMSDEFDGSTLDSAKWHIQGQNNFYYSNFTGRETWRYEENNAAVNDGLLKITTRYDPDPADPNQPNANFSTAGVVSKNTFQYGYMEIRARTTDAEVASTFWTTGMTGTGSCFTSSASCSELDVFEMYGRPIFNDPNRERRYWSSIHDWSQPGGPTTWTDTNTYLNFDPTKGFHTYGLEWNPEFITFHVDGIVLRTVTKQQVEAGGMNGGVWAIDDPSRIWVDSEIFEWMGEPPKQAGWSEDYEIDYIRVWKRLPQSNAVLETFEDSAVGVAPDNPPWTNTGGLTVRAGSATTPFGANNRYLESVSRTDAAGWAFAENNTPNSPVATTSFDLVWNGGNDSSWLRWALGTDAGIAHWLDVNGGNNHISPGTDFAADTPVRIDLVWNVSGETVAYHDGESVADKTIDVWIDGVLVEDDLAFNRAEAASATTTSIQHFWHNNGGSPGNSFVAYDNMMFTDSAVVTGTLPSLLGDFDGDDDVDLSDLDLYNGNLGAGATGALEPLDLDEDGDIDLNDLTQHYTQLVETSNGGKGTFARDLNLDGKVDVLGDAFALIGNLGVSSSSWSQGDINADQTVNVLGDAFALIGNLGRDNGGSAGAP